MSSRYWVDQEFIDVDKSELTRKKIIHFTINTLSRKINNTERWIKLWDDNHDIYPKKILHWDVISNWKNQDNLFLQN